MSHPEQPCPQFSEVDLADYLVEPERSEWAAFKAHFPTCDECRTALESWSAIEWQLADSGEAHPDLDDLDAFVMGGSEGPALPAPELSRIELHLERCAPCKDQVRALERFVASQPVAERSEATAPTEAPAFWASLRAGFERLLAAPAPAMGLMAAAAVVGWLVLSSQNQSTDDPAPEIVHREAPDSNPSPTHEMPIPESPSPNLKPQTTPIEVIAENDPPAPSESAPESLELAREEVPEVPRTTPTPDEPTPIDPPTQQALPLAGEGEILLAALDLPGALDYRADSAWMSGSGRMDLIGRGRGEAAEIIQVVAPQSHSGRVASASPILLWSLSEPVEAAIDLQLVDERKIDPILRVRLEGPHEEGLQGIDLSEYGIELDPEIPYILSAALEVDADRPSRNPRSRATLIPAAAGDPEAARVRNAEPGAKSTAALKAGFWYDGVGELARVATTHSNPAPVRDALAAILSQEKLSTAAAARITIHHKR